MFAFLFSTYVCTPQMNLALLPFFVLLPALTKRYTEFLAFEIVNALVIVWGFSAPLAFLGINIYMPAQYRPIWVSPVQFLAVLRSLWIGKFVIVDGLIGSSIKRNLDNVFQFKNGKAELRPYKVKKGECFKIAKSLSLVIPLDE